MAYVAASDYIEFAHVKDTYSSDDEARWTNQIARASALVDKFCGRSFEANTITGTSDAPITRYFDAIHDVDGVTLLFDKDLCVISSIKNGDSDATTITTDKYVTEPRNETPYYGIRLLTSSNTYWTYDDDNENAIAVAGTWAYSTTAPADIQHAVLRTVDWMEKVRTSTPDLDRPVLAGEGNILLPTRLPADVQAILAPYRKVRVI